MTKGQEIIKDVYQKAFLPATQGHCEDIHHLVLRGLGTLNSHQRLSRLCSLPFGAPGPDLSVTQMGIRFPFDVGFPAGLDKDAKSVFGLSAFGAGHIEIGTITLEPWRGNPNPPGDRRLKRYNTDRTIVNWMGLPGQGALQVMDNFERGKRDGCYPYPVGFAVSATPGVEGLEAKKADMAKTIGIVMPHKPGWISFNACPNAHGQDPAHALEEYVELATHFARTCHDSDPSIPRVLKLSPDLPDVDIVNLCHLARRLDFSAISAVNTTLKRSGPLEAYRGVKGGISGRHLHPRSVEVTKIVRKHWSGTVIGGGGVMDFDDYVETRRAGADLVTVLSGFIFNPLELTEIAQNVSSQRAEQKAYRQWVRNPSAFGLTNRQSEILTMYFNDGLTIGEISQTLGNYTSDLVLRAKNTALDLIRGRGT